MQLAGAQARNLVSKREHQQKVASNPLGVHARTRDALAEALRTALAWVTEPDEKTGLLIADLRYIDCESTLISSYSVCAIHTCY
jgi:hypothetical protein